MHIDGHELGILGTVTGLYSVTNGVLGKNWIKTFIHRQPVAAFSTGVAVASLLFPVIVVPIRRKLGYPTNQYDGGGTPGTIYPDMMN